MLHVYHFNPYYIRVEEALGMKMDQNKVLAGMTESPAAGELQRIVSPS